MIIVLLGYMGCGKTTVGQLLTKELGLPFQDLDHIIEQEEGLSISQIFEKKGDLYFRKRENELLLKTISQNKDLILSLGGGTPCYYDSMSTLLDTSFVKTIYLQVNVPELTHRLWKEKDRRPLIAAMASKDELMEYVGKHVFERNAYYNRASITIQTSDLELDEIISRIKEVL